MPKIKDNVRIVEDVDVAKLKQAARDQDARRLASGLVSPSDLDRKNGFFGSFDFSSVKIVSIGERHFEDVD